jgi:pyruvate formate lyase activating enzyme
MLMAGIRIGGIEKFSIVDFPNKMAAVVFMQGCPWRCPFCHNVQFQDVNAETNIVWHKFIDFLEQRKGILDAVVFSGGEPLVQEGLVDAIKEVKALGYIVGLHTGGYRPKFFKEILDLVDWVGFDIKAPLEKDRYKVVTGGIADADKVLESLKMLCESGKSFECRTTCDPRFLTVDDLSKISKELKSIGVKKYYLQKYRPIASDNVSTDSMCEELVSNTELLSWLKENFTDFEVRK